MSIQTVTSAVQEVSSPHLHAPVVRKPSQGTGTVTLTLLVITADTPRMPIAAAAGVIAGGVYIMLPTRGKSPERTLESDMVAANSTAIGYIGQPSGKPGIASHYRELRDGKEVESMKELSGRKGGGSMGPFRAE